jgi:hypothetical protein
MFRLMKWKKYRWMDGHRKGEIGQRGRQADGHTEGQTDARTYRQKDDRQMTDRWNDQYIDR